MCCLCYSEIVDVSRVLFTGWSCVACVIYRLLMCRVCYSQIDAFCSVPDIELLLLISDRWHLAALTVFAESHSAGAFPRLSIGSSLIKLPPAQQIPGSIHSYALRFFCSGQLLYGMNGLCTHVLSHCSALSSRSIGQKKPLLHLCPCFCI